MVAFNEYQAILESKIEALVQECGITPDQFFLALKANTDGDTPIYVEVILSATDFDEFLGMMRDYKRQLKS